LVISVSHFLKEKENVKLSQEWMESVRNEFDQQPWFVDKEIESTLSQDDRFVELRWVTMNDRSRFNCLFGSYKDRYYCRIPHILEKGKACGYSSKKTKDVLAHVREYFDYKPYVCEGYQGRHEPW
jgi:hypothetical protein